MSTFFSTPKTISIRNNLNFDVGNISILFAYRPSKRIVGVYRILIKKSCVDVINTGELFASISNAIKLIRSTNKPFDYALIGAA
jgi:hypothetical protein